MNSYEQRRLMFAKERERNGNGDRPKGGEKRVRGMKRSLKCRALSLGYSERTTYLCNYWTQSVNYNVSSDYTITSKISVDTCAPFEGPARVTLSTRH